MTGVDKLSQLKPFGDEKLEREEFAGSDSRLIQTLMVKIFSRVAVPMLQNRLFSGRSMLKLKMERSL